MTGLHHMSSKKAFTLIELLVVVAIIALLIGILLPSLAGARNQARQAVCGSNLHSVGQGIAVYTTDWGTYPASYIYEGQTFIGGKQSPDAPNKGYIHWSYYIYGDGKVPAKAFLCPVIDKGGLPPTNTTPDNRDSGQTNDPACPEGTVDKQAPRVSYTLNEALCPRNKWEKGFQGAPPNNMNSKYVKASQVTNNDTILATEFWPDWRIVSEAGYGSADTVCKSHRPVHGFRGLSGELNINKIALPDHGKDNNLERVTVGDLSTTYPPAESSSTRLDWVGRNHGSGDPVKRNSNFLYVDGHVETKHISKTVNPFQWGDSFFSAEGGNSIVQ